MLASVVSLSSVCLSGCGVDTRPAEWAYISPVIMQPNCATSSCHSRGAAVAGLDFSDVDRGYTSLTGLKVWIADPVGMEGCTSISGTTVCQRNFRPLVTPYNPGQSRLVNMLRARDATRMPPDRPLPEADIELVEQWIRNGATLRRRGEDGGSDTGDAAPSDAAPGDGPRVTVTVTGPDGQISTPNQDAAAGDSQPSDVPPSDGRPEAASFDALDASTDAVVDRTDGGSS